VLYIQQTTAKASVGRKAALGLRHIGLFEAPSPSALRWRRHVAIRPTSCLWQTLFEMFALNEIESFAPKTKIN
jgi:hypothetical protein